MYLVSRIRPANMSPVKAPPMSFTRASRSNTLEQKTVEDISKIKEDLHTLSFGDHYVLLKINASDHSVNS